MSKQNSRKNYFLLFASLWFLTWLLTPTPVEPGNTLGNWLTAAQEEMPDGGSEEGSYYRMVDENGETIVITARRISPGDIFLDENNCLYEVYEVENKVARAKYKGTLELEAETPPVSTGAAPGLSKIPYPQFPRELSVKGKEDYFAGAGKESDLSHKIGIYHTHNAESFIPTDGAEYIYGQGGIHKVGQVFKETLDAKGIEVVYSEKLHLPHDRGAYRRSRITAREVIGQGVDAVFDVHRDAVPAEEYESEIEGVPIAQVMIVVGRANPNMAVNRSFAYDLKAHADNIYPGLMRGVFVAHGNYNQDLSPMNLLLEVGTRDNLREEAKRGMELFAHAVSYYFYGPEFLEKGKDNEGADTGEGEQPEEDALPPALYHDAGGVSSAVSGTVIGLLGASLLGALGFFYLNNPEAGRKTIDFLRDLPQQAGELFHGLRSSLQDFRRHISNWPELKDKLSINLRTSFHKLAGEARALPRHLSWWVEDKREAFRYQLVYLPDALEKLQQNWGESLESFRQDWAELRRRFGWE